VSKYDFILILWWTISFRFKYSADHFTIENDRSHWKFMLLWRFRHSSERGKGIETPKSCKCKPTKFDF